MARVYKLTQRAGYSQAAPPAPVDPAALFGSERTVPSTAAQREIFSAAESDRVASRGYNHSISLFLTGPLDHDALYSALLNLVDRHEALRGRFSADGTEFMVRERIALEMPITDLGQLDQADGAAAYDRFIRAELDHVFDLKEGPLFRATLVRRGADDSVLVFNCHHAIVDGWSLKIILAELPQLYSDLVLGRSHSMLPAAASYLEYLGLAARRERERAEDVAHYWQGVFRDPVAALDLPVDHQRPPTRTYACLREDYRIEHRIYTELKAAGARRGASQFVTLLSAFALFLGRIAGLADFVVGVPAAGQITSGKSGLLGHDARVMPIRCRIEEGDTFGTFSQRIMEAFLAAYEHQWITIPELLRAIRYPIEPSRAPLIAVMFNFDPGMDAGALHFEGLRARHFFNHRNAETFEISVNAVVEEGDLILEWAYNRDLFDAAEMHARLEQFEHLMAGIARQPDSPVESLPLIPSDQVARMDALLNSTGMDYPREICADHLVEKLVLEAGDKVAVEYGSERLTYQQLWQRSGEIAAALASEDLGPLALVGVMLERSADMVAVLLGVWRAGAAFVPLDPAYPDERLDYMVEHSGMRVLLSQAQVSHRPRSAVRVLDVGALARAAPQAGAAARTRRPTDLAYVIYTSGSTGKPKGVQVPHAALVNFLTTMRTQAPGISAADRLLAVTTLSFDIAELELWLPLVTGATTVIADRATVIDGAALARTLSEARISFLQATPSTWRVLLASGWQGDPQLVAMCGGEALPRDLALALVPRVRALWNAYGPTETTIWSTIDRVTTDVVTIGKPIGNTQAYVLDARRTWVPRGSIGELWLGGCGVTRGYLGRDDLTRERFIANPFTGEGQIYRTGDLVRMRTDGRLEYVGRNDFQVKVRGYRIELGEVQLALSRLPSIRQCVVVVRDRQPGDAHLVAFYTAAEGARGDATELRAGLRASLPDYMIPGWFVEIERLPLTANGKIDVKALPDPFGAAPAPAARLGPIESLLAEHPLVREAALWQIAEDDPDCRPVAFVVCRGQDEPSAVALRKHLRGRCPEALIPEKVVCCEALPFTRERTIDRERLQRLLPGFAGLGGSMAATDAPRTPNEVLLANAWREVLQIPYVGIQDRFFDLGGHSLLSIQMIARVAAATGYRLTPRHVVVDTLGQLAARMSDEPPGIPRS